MGGPLPPAALRLLRRRTSLVAVVVVAVMALAASQIATGARARITAEIDANWRGAYDILVRPGGARLDLESTNGLVEPNFVALAGQGGISSATLAAIKAIPDVEIAAPISWVGFVTTRVASPTIEIPRVPSKPTLYSATLSVSTSDGVSRHLVSEDTLRILLAPDETNVEGCPTIVATGGTTCLVSPDGTRVLEYGSSHAPPQFQSPILAVDPVAERALLGSAGAFLDPLAKLPNRDGLTVGTVDEERIVLRGYGDWRADIGLLKSLDPNTTTLGRPVIPILVSARTYAPIQVSLEVRQVGQPLTTLRDTDRPAADVLADAARAAGPGTTEVGTSTVEGSSEARALRFNGLPVPWPGTSVPAGLGEGGLVGNRAITSALTSRPTYGVAVDRGGGSTPAFRIAPQGTVPPGGPGSEVAVPGPLMGGPQEVRSGSEQSYRPITAVTPPLVQAFEPQNSMDRPFFLAPIGEYDLDTLELPDGPLSYVPYGAYDPPNTALVAGPDGRPVAPVSMNPTLNPTGLLQVPPMGIVDIAAAELLRGPAPIDAVRVRVAGIRNYGPDALAKVERAAGAIAALGLEVDVVAASSPQAVEVYVPAYDTSATPPGDLGWVRQYWTTLGAAPRVEQALGETNAALLLLALLAVAVVVAGTALVTAAARSREAAILAAIGWRRRAIVTWQAAESAVAGLIVLAVGVLGWALSTRDPVGLAVALFGGALFVLTGAVAAIVVRPSARRVGAGDVVVPHRWLGLPVGGPRTYALRWLVARPLRSATIVVGLSLAAATIAPALAILVSVGLRVGPTLLAGALAERLAVYQLALLALIGSGTLAFTVLALRVDLDARQCELRVLAAAGWRPSQIGSMLAWTRLGLALPGALLAAALAAVTAGQIAGADVPVSLVAALAGGLALSAILWGGLAGFRLVPSGQD